jgi:hypothetical protein
MKIRLHEEAAKHFNEKAAAFLYELKPDETAKIRADRPSKNPHVHRESSVSHVFVSHVITQNEITEMSSLGYVDHLSGRQVARFCLVDNRSIGLNPDSYAECERFIENLHRKSEINSFLSQDFLRDCAFEWFEKRYKGLLREDSNWIGFLTEKAEEAIKPMKTSIPISFLAIEEQFNVGAVTFEYFKKDFYDRYINHTRAQAEQHEAFDSNQFGAFETRFRSQYQGVVFASMTVEAEPRRCVEITALEVEKALMVLRFFCPTCFVPEIPCYFGIMGHTHIPEDYCFIFEGDFPLVQEGIAERRAHRWDISVNHVLELQSLGLTAASDLIANKDPSEFEDLILSSMSFFARSVTSREFQDRIVYALVSIETILLRDQMEPIQSSVGLRLAFLAKSDPKGRKEVKELINKAYKIRSSYIHHGKRSEDWALLRDLQHAVWTGIHNALLLTNRCKTQRDLLDYIESIILR